ncbi:hypothetical protein CHS0354_032523 [Potamilus streckersoni]|uniref:GDP-fucose protein O-fucosyltransferase 2 n=1 Tax=Potamilus streckersoni TaxID=2493646 RepID=A0AAE0SQV4_9BIVA|nr:hypothetical protein CHS0354_032523 [Potamilus streckersoni]
MFTSLVIFSGCYMISAEDMADKDVFQTSNQPPLQFGQAKEPRYLLYDVNPGEGFNLRRDVYIRVANLVKVLNEDEPWILVLPPWGRLYHWQTRELGAQIKIPWSTFFDLESLRKHIPVIEFEDYLKVIGKPVIGEVYYLQSYKEGWDKWEEKMDIRECIDKPRYQQDENGKWRGPFFYYDEVYAEKFACMSAQSYAVSMKPFLMKNTTARSVFLDRAEALIHGMFSEWSAEYWTARRSMRFSRELRDIGDAFREKYLRSNDKKDRTELKDWTNMKRKHGDALGGPYLAVHLRRKDYLHAHSKQVPTLKNAAKQIKKFLIPYDVQRVFVATDAPDEEFFEFVQKFKKTKIYRFEPTKEILEKYKDGGVAIIDQWICAHARVFVGTYVSTFTFRIHEEREILGFSQESTYNRLCGSEEDDKECEQPTKWSISY